MKRLIIGALALAMARIVLGSEQIATSVCHPETDGWGNELSICDIYAIDPDGPEFVPGGSTMPLAEGQHPAWSRDGTKIAFEGTGRHQGWGGLSVLDLTTGSINLIYDGAGSSPAWSPDGTRIAFGSGELYVMNADGSGVTQVTSNGQFLGDTAWSPDGATITFTCGSQPNYNVCAIQSDGTGLRTLAFGATGASWSPVSPKIVFSAGGTGLATMDPDGSNVTVIGNWCYWPVWSPDATRIACTQPYMGACDAWGSCPDSVVTMNADGTNVHPLANGDRASWTNTPLTRLLAPPLAGFQAWCEEYVCNFDASPSFDNDSLPTLSWDFGDGTTGTGTFTGLTTHTYSTRGVKTVTLTARDADGLTSTEVQQLIVANVAPVASFTFTCSGWTCSFDGSASSDSDGTVAQYYWSFGDGETANGGAATITHTYSRPDIFPVYLTVIDNEGGGGYTVQYVTITNAPPVATFTYACNNKTCTFDGTGSSDSDGTIVNYGWIFGDGSGANGASVTHTYASSGAFNVTLLVYDNYGSEGSLSKSVSIANQPPVASFTYACNNRTCTFDGSASSDSDGTISSYSWTFGDGSSGTGASTTHTYATSGSFNVTLVVSDNSGAAASQSKPVSIANQPPVASFTYACNNRTCTFDGSASSDSDGTISSYAWTFGDGSSAAGASTTHTYATSGAFNVTLVVSDNSGATASQSKSVLIVNQPPVASFTVACSQMTCSFNGSTSSDPDGTIASYAWSFGDGASGSGATIAHTYAGSGTFTVTLTVTDDGGATGATNRSVTVSNAMHSGDLDGSVQKTPPNWNATVTVTIHDASHTPIANASVTASWSTGQSSTCVTNAAGQCAMSLSSITSRTGSVTLTLQSVTRSQYQYNPAANHDPDGDSNGTAIVLNKP